MLITEGASHRGIQHAQYLSSCNAKVILAARSLSEAERASLVVEQRTKNKVWPQELDLACFQCVRRFVDDWEAAGALLHVLVNNADERGTAELVLTEDGIETVMQVCNLVLNLLYAQQDMSLGSSVKICVTEHSSFVSNIAFNYFE